MRIQNIYEMTVEELKDYVRGCQAILNEKINSQEQSNWAELKTAIKKYIASSDLGYLTIGTEQDAFTLDEKDIDIAMANIGIIEAEFD